MENAFEHIVNCPQFFIDGEQHYQDQKQERSDYPNHMLIREADLKKDALAIMDGARDFRKRVDFGSLFPQSDEAFIEAVSRIITLESVDILVAESKGIIVGGIGILFAPCLWDTKKLVGDVLFLCTLKNAPFRTAWLLIDQAMKRIHEKGAIPMIRAPEKNRGMRKSLSRIGLKPIETLFMDI